MAKTAYTAKPTISNGWRDEAMHAREWKAKTDAAMDQFAELVENWLEEKIELPLLLLAFHHIAMDHGTYARKKTLKMGLKSSVEKVSKVAPLIFPPVRIVKIKAVRKTMTVTANG